MTIDIKPLMHVKPQVAELMIKHIDLSKAVAMAEVGRSCRNDQRRGTGLVAGPTRHDHPRGTRYGCGAGSAADH